MWVLCIALSLLAAAVHLPIHERRARRRPERRMSRRARDLLLGVALAAVTLAGVAWQAGASTGDVGHRELPPLICPLH